MSGFSQSTTMRSAYNIKTPRGKSIIGILSLNEETDKPTNIKIAKDGTLKIDYDNYVSDHYDTYAVTDAEERVCYTDGTDLWCWDVKTQNWVEPTKPIRQDDWLYDPQPHQP